MSATTTLLRELCETAKLSQSEIARRTGIPQPRLSRWAAGDTPTGADDALKLAELHAALIGADGQLLPKPAEAAGEPDAPVQRGPLAPEPEHSQAAAYARRADDTVRALEHACGIAATERRRDDRRKVERRHAEGDGHAR